MSTLRSSPVDGRLTNHNYTSLHSHQHDESSSTQHNDATDALEMQETPASLQWDGQLPAVKPPAVARKHKGSTAAILLKAWLLEIIATILAVASLVGIIATSGVHSGQPLPNWKYGLSVNTIIAIFAKVLTMMILFVTGQGISHLKWGHFNSQSRPLNDLTIFDDASRGFTGATRLIWLLKGKQWVAFTGAWIITLMVLFDPFAQQLIHYHECDNPDLSTSRDATVAKANYNWDTGYSDFPGINYASNPMKAAINSGVFSSAAAWTVPVSCTTGNCTFDDFSTIGYCSACTDVTTQLKYRDLGLVPFNDTNNGTSLAHVYNITFASGFVVPINTSQPYGMYYTPVLSMATGNTSSQIDIMYGALAYGTMQGLINGTDPDTYANGCVSYYNLTSVTENTWLCPGYGAATCSLFPCVKNYSAFVHKGKAVTKLVSTSANEQWGDDPDKGINYLVDLNCLDPGRQQEAIHAANHPIAPGQRYIYGLNLTEYAITDDAAVNTTCVYGYPYLTTSAYESFFSTFFAGNATAGNRIATSDNDVVLKLYNNSDVTFNDIQNTFANVSEAMTSYIRENPDGASSSSLINIETQPNSGPVLGTAIRTQTCVRVAWGWIAFPTLMVLLAVVFLVGVIVHSGARLQNGGRNGPVVFTYDWKGDPLLVLRAEEPKSIALQGTGKDLSRHSKGVRAILEFDEAEGRWKFLKTE